MWYTNVSKRELQELALQGKVTNRIISWRIMLEILTGTHDEKIEQSWKMRKDYNSLKEELEPKATEELDPLVFNPLSQNNNVRVN